MSNSNSNTSPVNDSDAARGAPPESPRHQTFSCLAEVTADIDTLIAMFRACGPERCSTRALPALANGIPLELHFLDGASFETVASRIRMVADSHVMLQTLQPVPLAKNPLERDWNRT